MNDMTKKQWLAAIATLTAVSTGTIPAQAATNFTDIGTYSESVQKEIEALTLAKIVQGTSETTFSPARNITRAQVVKLLGRFLVNEGYAKVPEDWETKQRFNDVSLTATDKDLLLNAAVVYDAKVFQGSNGALMSTQFVSRENMALILDRASKVILGKSFSERYKEDETLQASVKDIFVAKAESRVAIEALKAFGVSNVDTFNPKSYVTRANFVSFLHRAFFTGLMEPPITITEAVATSKTTLSVTLSDGTKHEVTLKEALEENLLTTVTFMIDETEYSATVMFKEAELRVKQVEQLNGAQLAIHFNHAITTVGDVSVRGIDVTNGVNMENVTLSADKRTAIVTLDSEMVGRYVVAVSQFKAASGVTNTGFDEVLTFEEDTKAPTISGTEQPFANRVVVKFSEPLREIGTVTLALEDGTAVVAATSFGEQRNEVVFDLSSTAIPANAELVATFVGTADIAGNLIAPNPSTTTFQKEEADGTPPTITEVEQTGAKEMKIVFSEAIRPVSVAQISVSRGTALNAIVGVTHISDAEVLVKTTDVLDGLTTVIARDVEDLSGEIARQLHAAPVFTVDRTPPVATASTFVMIDGHQYMDITFDKPVYVEDGKAIVSGTYIKDAVTHTLARKEAAVTALDAQTVRVKVSAMSEAATENAQYIVDVAFNGVVSDADVVPTTLKNVAFTRAKDTTENTLKIAVTNVKAVDPHTVEVTFSANVDAKTATDIANYTIDSVAIEKAVVHADRLHKAVLTLAPNSVSHSGNRYMAIQNIQADGSTVKMDAYQTVVDLTENTPPQIEKVDILQDNQLKITFSEAVIGVAESSFVITNGTNTFINTTTTTDATTATPTVVEAILTLRNGESFDVKEPIVLTLHESAHIHDAAQNVLNFDEYIVPVAP